MKHESETLVSIQTGIPIDQVHKTIVVLKTNHCSITGLWLQNATVHGGIIYSHVTIIMASIAPPFLALALENPTRKCVIHANSIAF